MPIPGNRSELIEQLEMSFAKLDRELERIGPREAKLPCVDDWTIRDLLAVRAWWTERVADWIEAGRRDEEPETPAPGYRWTETPRLNADVVRRAQRTSSGRVLAQLRQGYRRVRSLIDDLDDSELLQVGVFAWAGKHPISRWISINTTRQYTTARTHLRRALKSAGA